MPASFHSRSSAEWVPLLSPREAKGAFAWAIFFRPATASRPFRLAGSGLRPHHDEIVVHHLAPLDEEPFGDRLLFGLLVVDERDIGVAALAQVERLAGAERHHAHLNPGLLLERGQQVLEQTALLGRSGGSDGDESLLCFRRERRHSNAPESIASNPR
jgi:hypothetical protein